MSFNSYKVVVIVSPHITLNFRNPFFHSCKIISVTPEPPNYGVSHGREIVSFISSIVSNSSESSGEISSNTNSGLVFVVESLLYAVFVVVDSF